jgi:hypothetical protein
MLMRAKRRRLPATRVPSWVTATFVLGAIAEALAAVACIPPGTYKLLPCTQTATPDNLQAQVNAAIPGAVICMGPGVFHGSITFQGKNGVALRGQGSTTVIAGGGADGILVFNSQNLTFQDLSISGGHPTDAYISNSQNIALQGLDIARAGVGVHFDSGSSGSVTSSRIYSSDTDGVLIRRGSTVEVGYSVIFDNGGTGVSAVGAAADVILDGNVISHNAGPGVFAGQVPCAPLPGGSLDVPPCYLGNPQAFVSGIHLTLTANTIQGSGSTGVVLFPGTTSTFTGNHIGGNRLTGVFVWGANLASQGDELSGNEEHAIELRAYPSPLPASLLPAVGSMAGDEVHGSVVLAATGKLGGGVLAQGARLDVTNSRIHDNRGIGVSFVNGSTGSIVSDQIVTNGGSAICLSNAGNVQVTSDDVSGNASDTPGVCLETN